MEELLKGLGYTLEQIKAIVDGMKANKIYTTTEENLDTRYTKLNSEFTAKDQELIKANDLIATLQKSTTGNEDLQNKITTYETEISTLKETNEKEKIDNALKFALLANKAKAEDIKYLIFNLKENNKDGFKLDDSGNIKDFNFDDVKKTYSSHFEIESKKQIDVKNLGNGNGDKLVEPDTLLGALQAKYAPKNEI